jgi:F-type H+-transporting ATPase subunit delta
MSLEVLANRYLNAYINCFEETNKLTAFEDLKCIVGQIIDTKELFDIFTNPCISFAEKSNIVKKIVDSKKLIITNFILLIISKNRSELFSVFNLLIDSAILEFNNSLLASVYTPINLQATDTKEIKSFLSKKFSKEIILNIIIDDSILAGVRIEVSNKVFDATLNSSLKKLKLAYK